MFVSIGKPTGLDIYCMFCGPCEPLFLCISEIEKRFETDHQGSFFSSSMNWTMDMCFNGYIFISWNGGCLTPW